MHASRCLLNALGISKPDTARARNLCNLHPIHPITLRSWQGNVGLPQFPEHKTHARVNDSFKTRLLHTESGIKQEAVYLDSHGARLRIRQTIATKGGALLKYSVNIFGHLVAEYILLLQFFLESRFKKGSLLLDAGCGKGRHISMWKNFLGVGLDIDKARLRELKTKLKDLRVDGEVLVGDVDRLPFKEGVFDAVVSCDVLEHLRDPEDALEETAFVLKPKGSFLIATSNTSSPHIFASKIIPKVSDIFFSLLGGRPPGIRYYKINSVNKITEKLEEKRFVIKKRLMMNTTYPYSKSLSIFKLWRIYNALTRLGPFQILSEEIVIVCEKMQRKVHATKAEFHS
ncbi:MAG: class I SAM-dependent methyltransferase [Candidatus Hodarchaeota archaeon]